MSEVRTTDYHKFKQFSDAWSGPQSWNYSGMYEIGGRTLRVRVVRDAYEFQSRAEVSMWKDRWVPVWERPITHVKAWMLSAYEKDQEVAEAAMAITAEQLLDCAVEILGL